MNQLYINIYPHPGSFLALGQCEGWALTTEQLALPRGPQPITLLLTEVLLPGMSPLPAPPPALACPPWETPEHHLLTDAVPGLWKQLVLLSRVQRVPKV